MAKLTSMKAIRKKCLECSSGQPKEVRLCPIKNTLCSSTELDTGRKVRKISPKRGLKENRKLGAQFLTERSST